MKNHFGGTVKEVGPGIEGRLPSDRQGLVSGLCVMGYSLVAAVNGGREGLSSVLVWNGLGWHEVYRAPDVGEQITSLWAQSCQLSRDRLWIAIGGDLAWIEWPNGGAGKSIGAAVRFQHEASIESGKVDMGRCACRSFLRR